MIRLNLCSSFFAVVMPAAGFDTSVKAASPWFARLARDSRIGFPCICLLLGSQWADGKEKMQATQTDMLKRDKFCDNSRFYAIPASAG